MTVVYGFLGGMAGGGVVVLGVVYGVRRALTRSPFATMLQAKPSAPSGIVRP